MLSQHLKFRLLNHLAIFGPIFLLSVFSKLFEKIIETRMIKFTNKHNILTSQFGFRENSSTELAISITTFYDKLLNNLNDNKITCSIFLDLKQALDSINHDISLKKLYHYRFRGPIFNFLRSYLARRMIRVNIAQKLSKPYL